MPLSISHINYQINKSCVEVGIPIIDEAMNTFHIFT